MANQVYANNASAVLASGITDSATTITVASGQGASFPTVSGGNWAYITLVDTSGNLEIVKCTAHSAAADTFTCTRGQDGTTARAFSANDLFELRVTKATLDTLRDVASQTSGTLDGVTIGVGTPAAGAFTTLTATGNVTLGDAAGDLVKIGSATQVAGAKVSIATAGAYIGLGSTYQVLFGEDATNTAGFLGTFTNHDLIFRTNNTSRGRIDSNGNLLMGVTSATSSGGKIETSNGLTFPATQSACANANTLDDYEEGTWTATVTFGGANVGMTYATRTAHYVKVGSTCFFQLYLRLSAKGSSTGVAVVGGLPFTSDGSSAYSAVAVSIYDPIAGTAIASTTATVGSSSTNISLYSTTGGTLLYLTQGSFTDNTAVVVSGHYKVA